MPAYPVVERNNMPKKRPCEYSFKRYIGQKIIVQNGEIGKIVKIEPYYTFVETKKCIWAMTPTTIRMA